MKGYALLTLNQRTLKGYIANQYIIIIKVLNELLTDAKQVQPIYQVKPICDDLFCFKKKGIYYESKAYFQNLDSSNTQVTFSLHKYQEKHQNIF